MICFLTFNNDESIKMSNKIRKFQNVFSFKIAIILFFITIKIMQSIWFSKKKFFYELLYNIFQKKLKILQKYIKNNFANNRIRYSMIDVNAFILFVFKSNNKFRLCVNYKNFNAITLKNKFFLFFIEKTFDRFVDAKYFTKLNFKNVYYKIRIKTNDE